MEEEMELGPADWRFGEPAGLGKTLTFLDI
jgi:hypothetical protein